MTVHDLPAVNATLNGLSAVLLAIGYLLIRSRRVTLHRRFMLAAFATSSLFLICYVVYHAQVGSVRFPRQGFVRPLYFTILITHVTLAAAVQFAAARNDIAARRLFFGSLIYLPFIWIAMIADKL